MILTEKFKKDISTLRAAANGDFYLDVKNPKLYRKVRRYYENEGVVFSGDPLDDYDILMDVIEQEFESVETIWDISHGWTITELVESYDP